MMKKKVLFVDDEPNIIQGLKRMLYNMRESWDMFFAGGGEEALKILSENDIDVIVTDMRMPGMDGAQLLDIISKRCPQVVRIVLSGYSDQEMVMKTVKSAHQFLAKPCDAAALKHGIERACLLKNLLNNESLIKVVTGIKTLPSLPEYYGMIVAELQSPSPSLPRVGDIIGRDVAMTAKVLQFVNSAFFGLPNRISSPRQAVTLLGINTLQALILYVQVFSTIDESGGRTSRAAMDDLWKHSVTVGSLAGEIALSESAGKKVEDDAYAAGMLHDIGKLLLMAVPGYNEDMRRCIREKQCSSQEAEYELLGTSHAEAGAYLLGLWGINDSIVEAVAFHHNPSGMSGEKFTALTAVHSADSLLMEKGCDDEYRKIDMKYISRLRLAHRLDTWLECCLRISLRGN